MKISMINLWYLFVIWLTAFGIAFIHADMAEIRSRSKFERLLDKRSLVVALFYKNDRDTRKNKDLTRNIAELERMFKRISEDGRYKDAQVMFVRINVASKDAQVIADEYGVITLPTFMLFSEGRPVHTGGSSSRIATKRGFIRGNALSFFIDEYFGETINTIVQINAERRRHRERSHNSYTYVGYGVGAYPYYGPYGYPYYGYGGSVGFGFAF
jgi:hypothetical protein